jgi:hypothetical protein
MHNNMHLNALRKKKKWQYSTQSKMSPSQGRILGGGGDYPHESIFNE